MVALAEREGFEPCRASFAEIIVEVLLDRKVAWQAGLRAVSVVTVRAGSCRFKASKPANCMSFCMNAEGSRPEESPGGWCRGLFRRDQLRSISCIRR